ncbi:unnamed protein product [Thlaspi arvense]|uniref:HSF-type DNA-binding domain-containing protein n=1 Tax=Thlaspi arvense TaxID=13288 RepID=A0AAU9T6K5_THLAR|nr:unnamed protein product [Thlaspi arvense]
MTHSFSKRLPLFYIKVYKIVDDPSLDPIISWGKSNKTFIVWDLKGLCREILPKYPGLGRNHTQFVSQLEYYGFERVIGAGKLEFGHDYFVRGKPHLLKKMWIQALSIEKIEAIFEANIARFRAKTEKTNLETKIARIRTMIARFKASQDRVKVDRVKVEDLLQNLRI